MPQVELKCYGCKRTWEVEVTDKRLASWTEFKKDRPSFGQIEEANILGKCRRCGSGKVIANPMHAPVVVWHPTKPGALLDPDMTETQAEDALYNAIQESED